MSYIVTLHKSSSVLCSVYANFISHKQPSLVLAKINAIEVYEVTANGLALQYTLPVFGRVASLTAFRPLTPTGVKRPSKESLVDWLFISLYDGFCYVVSFDSDNGIFVTRQQIKLEGYSAYQLSSNVGHLCTVDPTGSYIALYAFQGYVQLFKIPTLPADSKRITSVTSDSVFPTTAMIAIDVVNILSMEFISGFNHPTLAVLYREFDRGRNIQLYKVESSGTKLKPLESSKVIPMGSSHIVPIALPVGGFLITGESRITYFDCSSNIPGVSNTVYNNEDPDPFIVHCSIDSNRYLLATKAGKLLLVSANRPSNSSKPNFNTFPTGFSPTPPTSLLHLGSDYFFASSHSGPSSLYRLDPSLSSLVVIQQFSNLAPILDLEMLTPTSTRKTEPEDPHTSFIACTGGFESGGIRKLQTGIRANYIAEIDGIHSISGIWSVQPGKLVLSSSKRTRVFEIDDKSGEIEELDDQKTGGISIDSPTIAIGLIKNQNLVQITAGFIRIIGAGLDDNLSWSPGENSVIGLACILDDLILVTVDRNWLVALDSSLTELAREKFDNQIACISAHSPTRCLVALWGLRQVKFVELPSLKVLEQPLTSLKSTDMPRSIIWKQFANGLFAFVGYGSGRLDYYRFVEESLSSPLQFVNQLDVGTEPVSLYEIDNYVVVVSNRVSIVFWDDYGGISSIPLTFSYPDSIPRTMASLKSPFYNESCQVFVFDDKILIASIGKAADLYIEDLDLKTLVRKVAVLNSINAIAVITTSLKIQNLVETSQSHLKLFDSTTFSPLCSVVLPGVNETAESITALDYGDVDNIVLVVGTGSIEKDGATKNSKETGQIIVFDVNSERQAHAVSYWKAPGVVYSLAAIQAPDNIIVATIDSRIVLLRIGWSISFNKSWSINPIDSGVQLLAPTVGISVSTYGRRVIVGDLMRSVFTFSVDEVGHIQDVVHCPDRAWTTDALICDNKISAYGDTEGNFRLIKKSETSQPTLDCFGSINLGDSINKLTRFNLTKGHFFKQMALLSTVSGAIYLYAEDHGEEYHLGRDNIDAEDIDEDHLEYEITTKKSIKLEKLQHNVLHFIRVLNSPEPGPAVLAAYKR